MEKRFLKVYNFHPILQNQGQTPLSAEIRPIVVVKDMNNEPPQFRGLDINFSNSYSGTVAENEPPGQTVIQIKAEDPDYDPPNNVVCALPVCFFFLVFHPFKEKAMHTNYFVCPSVDPSFMKTLAKLCHFQIFPHQT